jgi:hypothetical protein
VCENDQWPSPGGHPQVVVKGGLVSDGMLDANGIKALSTMPGLPELRSSSWALKAPANWSACSILPPSRWCGAQGTEKKDFINFPVFETYVP